MSMPKPDLILVYKSETEKVIGEPDIVIKPVVVAIGARGATGGVTAVDAIAYAVAL